MTVAFPALVIFLILLPGFIARSRIKRVERQVLDYSPFGQVVSEAVVWAGSLHIVWVLLAQWLNGAELNVEIVLQLLSTDTAVQGQALSHVAGQAGKVTTYFSTLLAAAYLLPSGIRWAISARRLDRLGSRWNSLFRFSGAPWYYLLSGADFDAGNTPDLIAVSAVVNVAGSPYIYTGLLDEYFIDQSGNLDRIVLQQVMRRPLTADKMPETGGREQERFYPVEGDYFVLRYSEAITLNIEYIKLKEELSVPAGVSPAEQSTEATPQPPNA
jgi:hypothetical protein